MKKEIFDLLNPLTQVLIRKAEADGLIKKMEDGKDGEWNNRKENSCNI